MAGENVIDYLYPEDPTGQAASNKVVDEYHTLTPPSDPLDFHFIIPDATPFFLDSVILTHVQSGRTLVRGIDWAPGQRFDSASFELKNVRGGVYASILFFDRTLNGQVRLDEYQTLGGGWTLNENKILEILSAREYDPRTLTYEEVSEKPTVFPPIEHNHSTDDLVGMGEVVAAQLAIAEAIRSKVVNGGDESEQISRSEVNELLDGKLDVDAPAVDAAKAFGMSLPQLTAHLANHIASASKITAVYKNADFNAVVNTRYYLHGDLTVTLPSGSGLPAGTLIAFLKSVSARPTISAIDGDTIVTENGTDTAVTFDVNSEIFVVWTGTTWEV